MIMQNVYSEITELRFFMDNNSGKLPLFVAESIDALGEEELRFSADEVAALSEDVADYLERMLITGYLGTGMNDAPLNERLITEFRGGLKSSGGMMLSLSRSLGEYLNTCPDAAQEARYYAGIALDGGITGFDGALSRGIEFRNNLMHGTFLASPRETREVIIKLISVLETVFVGRGDAAAPVLQSKGGAPYAGSMPLSPVFEAVKGGDVIDRRNDWSIMELDAGFDGNELRESIRKHFANAERFIDVYMEYLDEMSGRFMESEIASLEVLAGEGDSLLNKHIDDAVLAVSDGELSSFGVYCPFGLNRDAIWAAVARRFPARDDLLVIPYRFIPKGIRHTVGVFLGVLERSLGAFIGQSYTPPSKKKAGSRKGLMDHLKSEIKKSGKRVVVVIGDYHNRMFHDDHLRTAGNFIAECGIKLVGICYGYPELDRSFVKHETAGGVVKWEDDGKVLDELVAQYTAEQDFSESEKKSLRTAAGELLAVLKSDFRDSRPGFRSEEYVSLRRLHDHGETGLIRYPFTLVVRAARSLAPLLEYGSQERWFEFDISPGEKEGKIKKILTDQPVEFYSNFADMNDFRKFDPEDRRYRMFKNSVQIDRPETEVDIIYDTMGRDDLRIEYMPVAVKLHPNSSQGIKDKII